MQKAEPQHNHSQDQPAQRQGGSAALELPQGALGAQLEAMAENSPQASRQAQVAAMVDSSPLLSGQRKLVENVSASPYIAEQRGRLDNLTGGADQPEVADKNADAARQAEEPEGSNRNVPGLRVAAGGHGEAAEAGNAVPEGAAGLAGGMQEAAQSPKESPAAPIAPQGANPPPGRSAGAGEKGGADVAIDFLDAPASVIAKGVGGFGNRLLAGFQTDADTLTAETPAVTAGISTADIEPSKKIPAPPKAAIPVPGKWAPPAVASRSDVPRFSPAGDANPQQAETVAAAGGAQVAGSGDRLNAEIAQAPGEELVQGRQLNATGSVRLAASKASVRTNSVPEMEEYMSIDMPEGFRQQVDAASAGMFRQSLAVPREQIENAKARRDREHVGAILNANRQAEALGKKADEEQAQTVRLSREQIGAEKEKSLAESKSVLAEYDGKVSKEKQGKINEINAQIASHEKQANTALAEADSKVAAEQQKADRQKAEEERKGAEAKKNRKWWQKVGDFFSDIAKSVANAVTSIVNALASVVKSIVTAARNLANSIINACTALVKKLLDTFASVVKGLLDVALAAFPAIRNRLNAAIDKFVSAASAALDKIADTLKAAVNKLCDTLTQIIDFAQNFMVSAIQGAVMMFNAIITGNFADLPRIAFMTACNSLGLPGEELWSIVQKAAGQAMEIIKKPAQFLGNLIKAGMQGFGQFVGNIKQHIMSGLMGWLMGQVGQSGITLPEKFDGPGIFLLIRQVLGVTYEYVRERAVGIIGEKNAARVEMVLNYLKRLFTEPAALFAELKEKAAEMKDTFIDQIQDWAITTVIQKAVVKVTSMLIPGAGFVQAIYGMWQTLQFFLENIKKIAAVVNSLLDSMAQISKGAIGAAANYVEKTMVDTLPLVFAWLAKLIGIDGIGQKVKSIIDKLRTPVNSAVDFVIKGAMKLGSAVVGKVNGGVSAVKNKVAGWWSGRKEFTTRDGEVHAVYVEGEGKSARVVVNPIPKQDVSGFLDKAAAKLPEDAKQKQSVQTDITKARTALTELKGDMAAIEIADRKEVQGDGIATVAADKEKQEAQRELEGLAGTLQRIMEATGVALPSEGGEKQDAMAIDAVLAQLPSKGERTAEQKQAELDQAEALIKRIVKQSEGTDEIAGYFPKLTARYRLAELGFVSSGSGKYEIRARINPVTNIKMSDVTMQGTTLDGLKTDVKWDTGTLGGSTVGVKMVASRLGPDHPQGTPPGSGVQDSLMKQLVTNPGEDNENKYIRGHLLNDNLGGLGADYNLFPITGNANSQHAHRVEETVKKWVNINRYWVSYTVEVKMKRDRLEGTEHKATNYVDSTYHCTASVIHADGSRAHEITADIVSEYGRSHKISAPAVTSHKELPKVGKEADEAEVKLPTSKSKKVHFLSDNDPTELSNKKTKRNPVY
ncbi:MAG TPA: hypothetical protein VFP33_02590 [Gallionella sp.]|nr:hypothetical protein [Gallionella sp.]